MTMSLKSAGLAALSFAISTGVLAVALAPATASASTITPEVQVFGQYDSDVEIVTRRVAINDIDFTDESDLDKLDARLRRASSFVCGSVRAERMTLAATRCRVEAKRSADAKVAVLRERALALAEAGRPAQIATTIVVAAR